jgi:hypothetical protein
MQGRFVALEGLELLQLARRLIGVSHHGRARDLPADRIGPELLEENAGDDLITLIVEPDAERHGRALVRRGGVVGLSG